MKWVDADGMDYVMRMIKAEIKTRFAQKSLIALIGQWNRPQD